MGQRGRPKKKQFYPKCYICKGSDEVVAFGYHTALGRKKQDYYCKRCKTRFCIDDGFKGTRVDPRLKALAIWTKKETNASYQTIAYMLEENFGVKVSPTAVMQWWHQGAERVRRHMKSAKLLFAKVWYGDETYVKIRDRRKKKPRHGYIFNIGDSKGAVLASHVSKQRDSKSAERALAAALKRALRKPRKLVTDGHTSWPPARRTFLPRAAHKKGHFQRPWSTNIIERLHNEFKMWYHNMRGFKSIRRARSTVAFWNLNATFFRRRPSLGGRTLAEAKYGWRNPFGRNWLFEMLRFFRNYWGVKTLNRDAWTKPWNYQLPS